jgi:hypothetical protein
MTARTYWNQMQSNPGEKTWQEDLSNALRAGDQQLLVQIAQFPQRCGET